MGDSPLVLFGHEMPMRIKRKLLIYISRGNQLKCPYPNFLILYGLSDFQAVKVKHIFFSRRVKVLSYQPNQRCTYLNVLEEFGGLTAKFVFEFVKATAVFTHQDVPSLAH